MFHYTAPLHASLLPKLGALQTSFNVIFRFNKLEMSEILSTGRFLYRRKQRL